MNKMIEAQEIAKKLTKAQRRAVMKGIVPCGRGYWPLRHAMLGKGLINLTDFLSPLGLAVRQILSDTPQ
jgi:hypothetical protein